MSLENFRYLVIKNKNFFFGLQKFCNTQTWESPPLVKIALIGADDSFVSSGNNTKLPRFKSTLFYFCDLLFYGSKYCYRPNQNVSKIIHWG